MAALLGSAWCFFFPAGDGPGWTLLLRSTPHLDDIISAILAVDGLDSTDV